MALYRTIADKLARQIQQGAFQPGQRLPSVRVLAQRMAVSVSTAVAAYQLLERRQLVAARQKSGFYVMPPAALPAPARAPGLRPARLQLSGRVAAVFANVREPSLTPFGLALPAPDYWPAAALRRAAGAVRRDAFSRSLAFTAAPGDFGLRRQIAMRMLQAGCLQSPEDVVVTNGCQEAVTLSLRLLTSPGDVVAVESPCYYGFLLALQSLNLRVVNIATDPLTGLDLGQLQRAAERWPIRACICSPGCSNPTGAGMDENARARLLALARRCDFHIVEDDILGELAHGETRPPALKARDSDDRVLYCSSFSKSVAPGIRIGWVAAGRHRQRLIELMTANSSAVAGFSQLLMREYLQSGHFDKHLARVRREYRGNLQMALATIGRCFPPGTRATSPRGGFLTWVELPRGLDAHTLYERALAEKISIVPGGVFARKGFQNCFRLSCALPWSSAVNAALERLGRLASRL